MFFFLSIAATSQPLDPFSLLHLSLSLFFSLYLVLRVLRQQVGRPHRQPKLARVRQLADARAQVHERVAGHVGGALHQAGAHVVDAVAVQAQHVRVGVGRAGGRLDEGAYVFADVLVQLFKHGLCFLGRGKGRGREGRVVGRREECLAARRPSALPRLPPSLDQRVVPFARCGKDRLDGPRLSPLKRTSSVSGRMAADATADGGCGFGGTARTRASVGGARGQQLAAGGGARRRQKKTRQRPPRGL